MKIFGFDLTKMNTFEGREGIGTNAIIRYLGEPVGQFNDYGDGSCPDIDFYGPREKQKKFEGLLEEATQKYYARFPLWGQCADIPPSADLLLSTMADLTDLEKQYKKCVKKGNPILIVAEDEFGYRHCWSTNSLKPVEQIQQQYPDYQVKVYKSIDDFIIE